MNLQFDLLCCSDFSFTNTTSHKPSLHKRMREHGSHRAQHGPFLVIQLQTNHLLTVNLFHPVFKTLERKAENDPPLRGSAGTARWEPPCNFQTPQKEHRSHWCLEPWEGQRPSPVRVPGSHVTDPEREILGRAKGTHDRAPRSLSKDLAPRAMQNGPRFTLERLCPVYFTLIYICTGNNKKAIYYITIQWFLPSFKNNACNYKWEVETLY